MSKLVDKVVATAKKIDRKHGSKILLVGGIISSVAAIGFTVKQSFKAAEIVETHNAYREKIDEELPKDEYPEEDRKKAVRKLYFETGKQLVKTYALPFALEVASLGMFCGGHVKDQKTIYGLSSALGSTISAFTGYRKAVEAKIGEEKEKELYNGIRHEKVKNEETKKNEDVIVFDDKRYSPYSRFFDEFNPVWINDPQLNLNFLTMQQNIWTDKLLRDKVVFLNDVYHALGFEKIPEGQYLGWAVANGDDHIDFGIWDGKIEKVRDFVNGYEPSILLTFPNLSGRSVIEYI